MCFEACTLNRISSACVLQDVQRVLKHVSECLFCFWSMMQSVRAFGFSFCDLLSMYFLSLNSLLKQRGPNQSERSLNFPMHFPFAGGLGGRRRLGARARLKVFLLLLRIVITAIITFEVGALQPNHCDPFHIPSAAAGAP